MRAEGVETSAEASLKERHSGVIARMVGESAVHLPLEFQTNLYDTIDNPPFRGNG